MYEVSIEKDFSSSHYLRIYHGKDESLHNHDWKVQVKFKGRKLVFPEGYLIDFVETLKVLEKILAKINRKNLNEVQPFNKINPSAENIARWIYEEFVHFLPSVPPSRVTVWETDRCAASYFPDTSPTS